MKHKFINHFGGWVKPKKLWAERPIFGGHYIPKTKILPPSVDLRTTMPPIRDQGQLGSCTAFAWTGALQHMAMVDALPIASTEPSELAFYYAERALLGTTNSDSGASLSDGAKVSMNTGWMAESTWPYDIKKYTISPPNGPIIGKDVICLSVNQNANDIKTALAEGYGVAFGVVVYSSFETAPGGNVPMPNTGFSLFGWQLWGDSILGGHAIVLVGYDDAKQHFIFRNSWGTMWGDMGYGYLPYKYVLDPNLASDFWTPRKVV